MWESEASDATPRRAVATDSQTQSTTWQISRGDSNTPTHTHLEEVEGGVEG